MTPVDERAAAKINLDLWVVGRRADGYHELDSLVVFAPPCDRLRFQDDARLSLEVTGPFAAALAGEPDNLVLRATRLLAQHVGRVPGARIALDKRIPVAAGLGGGSADAAATLRGLNRLWQLGLSTANLLPLAAGLGADVPVCLAARPTRMRGIGDRLEPVRDLPELFLLLVNPRQPVSTAAVFSGLGDLAGPPPDLGPPPAALSRLMAWLRARPNHLEAPARRLLPAIGHVLAALAGQPGCALARMSGSGATCFGLFDDRDALARAAAAIAAAHPDWWVAPTTAGS
ncbi:MAG TPA: 4-(cytidine 5'-diphospho)-2-C-methyl-D-erythritol kinase [Geminicoccaceae bacterium]|nr:4-(cytidine 5'-diphospho)-2-C-methyl-D-erythritol kinase [Geminicoccaceae bacterium]